MTRTTLAIASASGTTMAADPALEKILPEQFLRMGMNTHSSSTALPRRASVRQHATRPSPGSPV